VPLKVARLIEASSPARPVPTCTLPPEMLSVPFPAASPIRAAAPNPSPPNWSVPEPGPTFTTVVTPLAPPMVKIPDVVNADALV